MKKYEKCKVVMLPTEKAIGSSIGFNNSGQKLTYYPDKHVNILDVPQHLYFLSDEHITKCPVYSWFYNEKTKKVVQKLTNNYENHFEDHWYKKIIATTDSSLNLPRPSNEFIKAYCDKGGINEVLIEYVCKTIPTPGRELHGTQIYVLKVADDNTITIKPIKDSWNREEVIELLSKAISNHCMLSISDQPYNEKEKDELIDNWISKNL